MERRYRILDDVVVRLVGRVMVVVVVVVLVLVSIFNLLVKLTFIIYPSQLWIASTIIPL